jgi:hypothetical protein
MHLVAPAACEGGTCRVFSGDAFFVEWDGGESAVGLFYAGAGLDAGVLEEFGVRLALWAVGFQEGFCEAVLWVLMVAV